MEVPIAAAEQQQKSDFEVKTFRISNVRLLPEEQIASHSQPSWELSLVVSGRGRRIIGASEEPFEPGDLVLVPPQVEHCWQFERDGMVRNITLEINSSWMENLPTLLPEMELSVGKLMEMKAVAITFEPHSREEIAQVLRRMVRKDRIDQLATLLHLIELMAQEGNAEAISGAERRATIDERRKERLRIFAECNYNRRISLDMAARQVGMSRTSFCRWFRENYATTFVAYIQSMRLQRMATLLSDPTLSINEACYNSGFTDTAYASRLFHARYGLTPRAYRETIAKP